MILTELKTEEGGTITSEQGRLVILRTVDRVLLHLEGFRLLDVRVPEDYQDTIYEFCHCLASLLSLIEESDSRRIRWICELAPPDRPYPDTLTRFRDLLIFASTKKE